MAYAALPDSPAQYLVLNGRSSTVVIEAHADEAPLWRWWGPRLADGALPPMPLRSTRPMPSFMLDHDQPLSVLPGFGVGWFGASALLAHRDGRDFSFAVDRTEVFWHEPGARLELVLHDEAAAIEARLHLQLRPAGAEADVLCLRTELCNRGAATLDLQWLAAATLPLPARCTEVISYAGQHNHEFIEQADRLSRSSWRRENRRGRTSHDCFPGAVVLTAGATGDAGLAYGAHLAWSGNHQQAIEWLHDDRWSWQLGEWLAPGEIRLAPGERFATPEVIAVCSQAGRNGVAAGFHAELRRRLPWHGGTMAPRPVHLNTWEAVYFDHDPAALMQLAEAAAAIGIERFVLDDGWFAGRHDDRAALGDWWADRGKYPAGLRPLADHVVQLGMQFGLWFEPEMVSPDSELHRAHPDWALQIDGRPRLTGRNQLVLDIARPEVSQYLFERIDALLGTLPIAYIKWDHNRDLATAAHADGRAAWHAQVPAAYALMDRLRAAHPALEIESCSGGGGRIDFAVLQRSHRVWTSDCIDALSRIDSQRGLLQFFPPEIMGNHVGSAPSHQTGRTQALAFRAAVALPGHLGVEQDVRRLDADARAELAGWIALYKRWRGLLHGGRVWLGDAGDGVVWQLHGDDAAGELILLCYRRQPSSLRYAPALPLPMLDGGRHYRLRLITPALLPAHQLYDGTAPFFEALRAATGIEVAGDWLRRAGLPLPRARAETAFIVHLQAL